MPDVTGYNLPNHDETFMYADKFAREELEKLPERFAPSGFGLGEYLCRTVDSWNNATKNGFYHAKGDSPDGNDWYGINISRDGSLHTQIAFLLWGYTTLWCVRKHNQGWQPWEWVNPPMTLGVEYRTTERYSDMVVYAKAISVSGIKSGSTSYGNLISPITNIIDSEFNVYVSGETRLYKNKQDFNYLLTNSGTSRALYLEVTTTLSSANGILMVKYTKD